MIYLLNFDLIILFTQVIINYILVYVKILFQHLTKNNYKYMVKCGEKYLLIFCFQE